MKVCPKQDSVVDDLGFLSSIWVDMRSLQYLWDICAGNSTRTVVGIQEFVAETPLLFSSNLPDLNNAAVIQAVVVNDYSALVLRQLIKAGSCKKALRFTVSRDRAMKREHACGAVVSLYECKPQNTVVPTVPIYVNNTDGYSIDETVDQRGVVALTTVLTVVGGIIEDPRSVFKPNGFSVAIPAYSFCLACVNGKRVSATINILYSIGRGRMDAGIPAQGGGRVGPRFHPMRKR